MMKAKKLALISTIAVCTLFAGSFLNFSAEGASTTSTPGTADDPVVTKSYVDQQIQSALGGGTATPSTPAQSENELKVVTLQPGKVMVADAGAEFIVRSGKAVIYPQDKNGVADLTDGVDLLNGQEAPKNHLLSFPREGRGIMVKSGVTSNLVVMVRGGYTIQ